MWINIFTAFTNLIAYYYLDVYNIKSVYSLNLTILISFLYHLSETKHDLPGIYPFNRYTGLFLNLDRIFSIYGLYIVCINLFKLHLQTIGIGILGLICLAVSEYNSIKKFLHICIILKSIISQIRKNKINLKSLQNLKDIKNIIFPLIKVINYKHKSNLIIFIFFHNLWHCMAYYVYIRCL
jgi:hypothetical protein